MAPDSPDPLTLPSSPLSAKPFLRRESRAPSARPRATLSPARGSPAKSFLIDPALDARERSPYRIRVTVSAEPTHMAGGGSGSPRKTRTTRVPLRGGLSSSPRKDATELDGTEVEGGVRRVKRKRKGTPVAPRRRARNDSPVREEVGELPAPVLPSSPVQSQQQERSLVMVPSSELRRRRIPPMRTQRYARLSAAREELDMALQDAVGEDAVPAFHQGVHMSSDAVGVSSPSVGGRGNGELTVANEDFTMISGEEMASIVAGTSLLHNNSLHAANDAEKTEQSVYPSSPPSEPGSGEVRYPDLTEVSQMKESARQAGYDVMSWQPSRPLPAASISRSQRLGRELELSRPREPITIEDDDESSNDEEDVQMGAANPADVDDVQQDEEDANVEPAIDKDDDIWAEEASRSLEEDAAVPSPSHKGSANFIPPIFSDEPVPPRRSKIPNTWRRVSGNDFTYSDSPARPLNDGPEERAEAEMEEEKAMETDAESKRSSGVLTPPSTDDETGKRARVSENSAYVEDEANAHEEPMADEDDEDDDQEISGLTEPNAADTQLEAHHRMPSSPATQHSTRQPKQVEVQPANEESENDVTGYYWQQHKQKAPSHIFQSRGFLRNETKTKYDLSAILRMDETEVTESGTAGKKVGKAPNQSTLASAAQQQPPRPQYRSARAEQRRLARAQREGLDTSVDSSQSLSLESSQVSKAGDRSHPHRRELQTTVEHSHSIDDSLASKASDQRQILAELKSTTPERRSAVERRPARERLQVLRQQDVEVSQQSYEENLNLESPQKIRVKFGDSSLLESAPLGTKNANAKLGTHSAAEENKKAPAAPLVRTKPKMKLFDTITPATGLSHQHEGNNVSGAGLLNRITSSLWSNINTILPQGPTYTYSPPATVQANSATQATHSRSTVPSTRPLITPTTPLPKSLQTLPISLRAHLRSRYGVLSSQHPWTMSHMRTLHRLLNSLESGRHDSIVPTHLPLPAELRGMVGRPQRTATGGSYMFDFEHACVVMAFMSLLVSPSLIEEMETGQVEALGDLQARRLRGFMGGRQGGEVCFRTVAAGEGQLGVGWVVQALGCCVKANDAEEDLKEEVEDDGFERAEVGSVMGDGRGDERVRRWIG